MPRPQISFCFGGSAGNWTEALNFAPPLELRRATQRDMLIEILPLNGLPDLAGTLSISFVAAMP